MPICRLNLHDPFASCMFGPQCAFYMLSRPCCIAGVEGLLRGAVSQGQARLSAERPRESLDAQLPPGEDPTTWSGERAYFATGAFSAAMPYEANEHGGAACELPLFSHDANKVPKGHGNCTKHMFAHGALSAGLLVRVGPS